MKVQSLALAAILACSAPAYANTTGQPAPTPQQRYTCTFDGDHCVVIKIANPFPAVVKALGNVNPFYRHPCCIDLTCYRC